ncbi:DUF5753 domain-containing protein [Kitasatospora aureofaciens]|uniref:DUF5753 domain-containing protein n=1 Tax=Kitasatospora aureofaciens TaxID=1894 RepID=UPI001C448B3B|nr:DUF5753 domain-containing protein [Kitasatospora aureofaciens]MBV6700377.1 DUF5753 domain-containing protein [Kitasatospora aureofaciens]
MASSPSSSAQAARIALAARLSHLLQDAGIKATELSGRCGWHRSKTSRILSAQVQPSDKDIRAWCAACNADDQAEDLIATARAVDLMYMEWRRIHRNGLRKVQEDTLRQYAQTRVNRVYVSNVVPGFFQTAPYATALLRSITDFQGTPDDVAEAVAARVARSRFLYEGDHRFVVVMEETVLRHKIGTAETMAGQLQHLLTVLPLPSVSLGIIPFGADRTMWPLEAFYLQDDDEAVVETLTAEVNVTQPRELRDYARAFGKLSKMAVYGDSARRLITEAIASLG